jgi:hypothetical protein
MVELPRQHIVAISEPPDFEDWKKRVRNASDEDLPKLQNAAHLGLRGDGGGNQRWSPLYWCR